MPGVPDIGTSNAQFGRNRLACPACFETPRAQVTSTRLIRDKRAAPQHEGAKDQGPRRLLRRSFLLIGNHEKIYWGHDELHQNRWLCSAGGSFSLE
jgi:hypothetical protein